ncbi:hypothetical protein [Streptomyces atratus]
MQSGPLASSTGPVPGYVAPPAGDGRRCCVDAFGHGVRKPYSPPAFPAGLAPGRKSPSAKGRQRALKAAGYMSKGEQRLDTPERARWPLPSIAAPAGVIGLALTLWQIPQK